MVAAAAATAPAGRQSGPQTRPAIRSAPAHLGALLACVAARQVHRLIALGARPASVNAVQRCSGQMWCEARQAAYVWIGQQLQAQPSAPSSSPSCPPASRPAPSPRVWARAAPLSGAQHARLVGCAGKTKTGSAGCALLVVLPACDAPGAALALRGATGIRQFAAGMCMCRPKQLVTACSRARLSLLP